jgi:hypothetical protein
MIPYRIINFTNGMTLRGVSDCEISVVFHLVITVDAKEQSVDVPAKLTVGSDIRDRVLEVYAPKLPVGVNIRADELHRAISDYFFAFLNDDGAERWKDHGEFSS